MSWKKTVFVTIVALIFSGVQASGTASKASKDSDYVVGIHEHFLTLYGEPKVLENSMEKVAPSSHPHQTYDHESQSQPPALDVGIELDLTVRSLEFKIDDHLVDHEKIWTEQKTSIFDLYDHVGKTTIPLNYDENDYWSQAHLSHKKFLMIPLQTDKTIFISVPEPQLQSADVYVIELPKRMKLDEEGKEVVDDTL